MLRTLVDESATPSAIADAEGRVVHANEALETLVGGAVAGRALSELSPAPVERVALGERTLVRWASASDDVRRALVDSEAAAQRARAAKSRFLASMSHELRTPLNAILGTAELLRRGGSLEPERVFASAQRIERNAHALLLLLDDLFDSTQIDEGLEIERGPFVLADLFRHAVEVAREPAESRGASLVLDVDPRLPERMLGDVRRLRQIVGGLTVRGARRAERGRVTIRARRDDSLEARAEATARGEFPLRIEVAVEGATQVTDAARSGLELLTRIAEAIDARLVCDDRHDRCVLSVAMPIAPASSSFGRAELRGQLARATLRGRVLVVDDTAESRELVASLLSAAGIEAEVYGDGESALEGARERFFDLALVDLRMPGLDGFALRSALHLQARTEGELSLPVVAVTADAVAGTRERCLAAGFADCLYKPIEGDAFLRAVRRRLRRNVLVADDDADLRALVAAFLEDAGWRVFAAEDGADAAARLHDRTVHALVVDLEMPGVDGFGLLARAREKLPTVPVIALTGHRDAATRRRAQEAGFSEVLTKPVEGALLVERLRTLMP